ncbi:Copper homeostasis protein CutE [Dissulfuribacter thermophilus]|uniref:Apolipoprotein N-acyltransferase n=1 Tax=Dissulfuribacter thermophilus TaxID=1156395 RepID=A0A1B9F7D3_9BACT|nr:apolipoprotein N-acyltransferase [Dissulfuribacter thermophilus]OCC15671.1 Copper homeostasis protein CutE [Dissulfuribacter thermophilus]
MFFALFGGLFYTLGLPGYGCLPCLFLGLLLFLYALEDKGPRQGFYTGFSFGMSHFFLLLWWLAPTINQYGRLPLPLTFPVVALLALYLSLYPALWACVYTYFLKKTPRIVLATLGGGLWGLTEWMRGTLFTGFPWGVLASSLHDFPLLIQLADLLSIYGISSLLFLSVLLIWGFIIHLRNKSWKESLYLFLGFWTVFLGAVYYGKVKMNEYDVPPDICAVAVQGAVPQSIKWDPGVMEETLNKYFSLTKEGCFERDCDNKTRLVVWPETAVTTYYQDDSVVQERLQEFSRENGVFLLFGSLSYEFSTPGSRPQYFNSAYLIGPNGDLLGRYDKRHLVPFGEYMPLGPFSELAKHYLPTAGDFDTGVRGAAIRATDGLTVGILICFESIFPGLARDAVNHGANILAVMTNDAWFGRTPAPYQHEAMSVFRAVETRRWVIRSANTGVSSIIAPDGTRIETTEIFVPAVITAKVGLLTDKSPYVRYGDYGFFLFVLLLCVPVLPFTACRQGLTL